MSINEVRYLPECGSTNTERARISQHRHEIAE